MTDDPRAASSPGGQRLGPYVIEALLAQGGMGSVYAARHEALGRRVALKTLRGLEGADPADLVRFAEEARILARVAHPNVVAIHDAGVAAGVHYLAMELVEGPSLAARLAAAGPLAPREAVDVVLAVGRGVAHAHEQGVLHRDLKAANVLLPPTGPPKLTDFGVARLAGSRRLTQTGTALGTPSSMAPEQALGLRDEIDARADVWGLGALLYEALTGRPPFVRASAMETLQAVIEAPHEPVAARAPAVDRDLGAVVDRCLAKAAGDRYATVAALLDDLERWRRGEPVAARAPGLGARAARGLRRVGPRLVVGALVAGALAAGALAGALARRGDAAGTGGEGGALEARARGWLEARLAGPGAGAPGPDARPGGAAPDALDALTRARRAAAELSPEALLAEAMAALDVPADDAPGRAAVARGLGADLVARVAPLRASRALAALDAGRSAGADGSSGAGAASATEEVSRAGGAAGAEGAGWPEDPPTRAGGLAEVVALDPDGPAGRAARLRLARLLARAPGRAAWRLAEQAAERASALPVGAETASAPGTRPHDAVRAAALLERARLAAGRGAWGEAARNLAAREASGAGAHEGEAVAREAGVLAALAAALAPPSGQPARRGAGPRGLVRGRDGAALLVGVLGDALAAWPATPDGSSGGSDEPRAAVALDGWRVLHLAPGPWSGEPGELVVVAAREGEVGVGPVRLDAPRAAGAVWRPAFVTAGVASPQVGWGDVDGDGRTDVVLVPWEALARAVVVLGGLEPRALPLVDADDPRRYAVRAPVVVDLDGDGRGEVVLPASELAPAAEVEVLALPPGAARLVSLGRAPAPPVRRSLAAPGLALLVVDEARQRSAAVAATGDAHGAWFGRDGLYAVGLRDGRAALLGRATLGPERAPDASARAATEQLAAVVVRRGRRARALLAWAEPGHDAAARRWRLASFDLDALRGGVARAAAPELVVAGPAPALAPDATAWDAAGDGQDVVLAGGAVLGPEPSPADAVPAGSAPPDEDREQALVWLARALAALGRVDDAEQVALARLRSPLALRAARLALVDAALAEAEEALEAARDALGAGDVARGRALLGRGRARAADAAARAEALPEALGGPAWPRAARAWALAREPARGRAAAGAGLAAADLDPAARAQLEALEADAALLLARQEVALELGAGPGRALDGPLGVTSPARTAGDARGVTVWIAPDAEDAVLAGLALDPAGLEVEGRVAVTPNVWATALEVGVFEDDGGGPGPGTGVRLELWDVTARRARARVLVGGQPVGPAFPLPRDPFVLAFRVATAPRAGGGVGVLAELALEGAGPGAADGDEDPGPGLIGLVDEPWPWAPGPVARRGAPGEAHLGATSRLHGDPDVAATEQPAWAMLGPQRVERLAVRARVAAPRALVPLLRAHAALAAGRHEEATRGYDEALPRYARGARYRTDALLHRGLARGRRGDPDAARDVVAAVRNAPWSALHLLEDLAAAMTPGLGPDRATLDAALEALAADDDPLLAAIGRSLRGDLAAVADPTREQDSQRARAAAHVSLRAGPRGDARRALLDVLRRDVPRARGPRLSLPAVLPPGPAGLAPDAAFAALVRDRSGDLVGIWTRMHAAHRLRPERGEPLALLGVALVEAGSPGLGEPHLAGALERTLAEPRVAAGTALVLARARAQLARFGAARLALARARELGAPGAEVDALARAIDEAERQAP